MASVRARALVATVEEAATAVLTLTEGLDEEQLARLGLTRGEVRRHLLAAADALLQMGPAARASMPELDWAGWRREACRMARGGPDEMAATWLAVRELAPHTLSWLRVYRARGIA